MVRPTINSEKHYVAQSLDTVDDNTIKSRAIASAAVNPSTQQQVRVGSSIKALYIELWLLAASSQPVFQITTIEKIVAGADTMTTEQASNLHTYPNKKNILFTTQGLVGDANSNPIPVLRQWIKIPKGKQRMGLGDTFYINVAARGEAGGNNLEMCGMFIYKEYF